jgi:squalene-associated FAD-dependent desaturase
MADRSAVVVGGGLAGIAAALRLADAGRAVTLVEARPRLGGAAFSFRRGELTVDNGQHVFLRCCDAYLDLLRRLDVLDRVALQPHLDIPVLAGDGTRARINRTPGLPAPLHLSAALSRYRLLSTADRARAVRGALALRRLDPADPTLDTQTLGAFLRAHGQTSAVIDALWGVVATATLNLPPDEASLALAAKVFRTGLLDRADAGDVGYALRPLDELHGSAAVTALRAAGVDVLAGARVESIRDGLVCVRDERDAPAREVRADAVVLAVPPPIALSCAPELADTPAAKAAGLGASPIVNIHVIFDRQVTDLPFAAAVGTCTQWVFDRTEQSGLKSRNPHGQYLAVTVSAADAVLATPSRTLEAQIIDELRRLLPPAARADVLESFVTRERRATFRQAAGTADMRPSAESGLPGVFLAGAWTATGWPDTMEGAVRSGNSAADAVLAAAS